MLAQFFERHVEQRRIRKVLLARGEHEQHGTCVDPTAEIRREADGELVRPVDILEDDDQRLSRREPRDEAIDSFEDAAGIRGGGSSRAPAIGFRKHPRELGAPRRLQPAQCSGLGGKAGAQGVHPRPKRQHLRRLVGAADDRAAVALSRERDDF